VTSDADEDSFAIALLFLIDRRVERKLVNHAHFWEIVRSKAAKGGLDRPLLVAFFVRLLYELDEKMKRARERQGRFLDEANKGAGNLPDRADSVSDLCDESPTALLTSIRRKSRRHCDTLDRDIPWASD
jgi:hypothetical protein